MEKRFATPADVRMRLNETFVRYKGEYYFATQSPEDQDTKLQLRLVHDKALVCVIDANDPDLDVSSLPLGYVQFRSWNECIFMSRLPYRRQRQAVSIDSVAVYGVFNIAQYPPVRDYFHQKFFINNLKGEFPTYDAVVSSIKANTGKDTEKIARAFDRCFCILYSKGSDVLLQYNCTNIGKINLETKVVTLLPEHNHSVFTMKLAELGVPVAE